MKGSVGKGFTQRGQGSAKGQRVSRRERISGEGGFTQRGKGSARAQRGFTEEMVSRKGAKVTLRRKEDFTQRASGAAAVGWYFQNSLCVPWWLCVLVVQ